MGKDCRDAFAVQDDLILTIVGRLHLLLLLLLLFVKVRAV